MKKRPLNYSRLCRCPKQFLRVTGLDIKRFDELYKNIHSLIEEEDAKRKFRNNRIRKIGGGAQYSLHLKDRLLMTLIYYRTYATQDLLGFIFKLNRSNVCRVYRLISKCLPKYFKIPEKRLKIDSDKLIDLFIDGTEQPVNRPKQKGLRKETYSGKKKGHRLKHQVTVSKDKDGKRKIESLSKSFKGRTHDKKMHDETKMIIPKDIDVYTDSGYLGTDYIMPKRKPKGRELTENEKERNKEIASKRCVNEHVIGFMKRYRIGRDQFRNRRQDHNLIFKNIAGLSNMMLA